MVHEEEVSSADVSSTSEVITQHLVTFRSVEELQKQNQRLLVALRELSDAQEKEEFEATGTKYVNMCADLQHSESWNWLFVVVAAVVVSPFKLSDKYQSIKFVSHKNT